VILSSDSLNSSPRPWALGMELQQRDPGDILAIPVAGYG
jgi:mRNA interferase MazF